MRDLLLKGMEGLRLPSVTAVRVHVGGDFWSQDYFDAWMHAAEFRPDLRFYAYTKSLHLWVNWTVVRQMDLPANFRMVASKGGTFDHLIPRHGLPYAVVVDHPDTAEAMNLEIDHDDGLAMNDDVGKFALLIHGPGRAGSDHNAATSRLRREKIQFSYSRKNRHREGKKHLAKTSS